MQLSSKIFVIILGIALIAVILSSLLFFNTTKVSFEGLIEDTQINLAEGAEREIGDHLLTRVNELRALSNDNRIKNFIIDQTPEGKEEVTMILNNFTNTYFKIYSFQVFDEIALVDGTGNKIAQNKELEEQYFGDQECWEIVQEKEIYIDNISDENGITKSLKIVLRITDANGNFIGVIKAHLSFQEIINIIKSYRTSGLNFKKEELIAYASDKHRTMEFRLIDEEGKLMYSTEGEDVDDYAYFSADLFDKLGAGNRNTFSYFYTEKENGKIKKLITYYPFTSYGEITNLNWAILIGHNVDDIFYPARNAALKMSIYMVPLIIVAGFAMLFFIKRIVVKPLNKFIKLTKNISESKFDEHLEINGSDELGILALSFNRMMDELKLSKENIEAKVAARTEELRKFQLAVENTSEVTVITDAEGVVLYINPAAEKNTGYKIKEIVGKKAGKLWGGLMTKKYYKDLWATVKKDKKVFSGEIQNTHKDGTKFISKMDIFPILNDEKNLMFLVGISRDITKEKEIDTMKTEFISLASHQLRTPLSAMKWFSEMLINGELGKLTDEQKDCISKIYDSNERMIDLVNSLLNVSKIESGKIVMERKTTNLKILINNILEELKPKIKEKQLKIKLELSDGLEGILVDPKLIFEVYVNILANAIKYSEDKTEISIKIYKKGNTLESEIKDNGLGIPKAEQSKLFRKFFRGSNVLKTDTDGSGLGMYLVKRIIDASGGQISFESEENKGTTFRFSIPQSMIK